MSQRRSVDLAIMAVILALSSLSMAPPGIAAQNEPPYAAQINPIQVLPPMLCTGESRQIIVNLQLQEVGALAPLDKPQLPTSSGTGRAEARRGKISPKVFYVPGFGPVQRTFTYVADLTGYDTIKISVAWGRYQTYKEIPVQVVDCKYRMSARLWMRAENIKFYWIANLQMRGDFGVANGKILGKGTGTGTVTAWRHQSDAECQMTPPVEATFSFDVGGKVNQDGGLHLDLDIPLVETDSSSIICIVEGNPDAYPYSGQYWNLNKFAFPKDIRSSSQVYPFEVERGGGELIIMNREEAR